MFRFCALNSSNLKRSQSLHPYKNPDVDEEQLQGIEIEKTQGEAGITGIISI